MTDSRLHVLKSKAKRLSIPAQLIIQELVTEIERLRLLTVKKHARVVPKESLSSKILAILWEGPRTKQDIIDILKTANPHSIHTSLLRLVNDDAVEIAAKIPSPNSRSVNLYSIIAKSPTVLIWRRKQEKNDA